MFRRPTFRSFLMALALLLCVPFIWYQSPRLAIDGRSPFATPTSRAWLIVVVFALWLVYCGIRWLVRKLSKIRISWQPTESASQSDALADEVTARSQEDRRPPAVASLHLQHRFQTVLQVLRKGGPFWRFGRHSLYRLPWYLLLGDEASGKTALMRESGLKFWHGDVLPAAREADEACQWWLAKEAVLLEPKGAISLSRERGMPYRAVWEDLLRRVKRARRRCPLNGVIVTVGARLLLEGDEAERAAFAQALRARIKDMHLALGIRIPIYVVVTHCDRLAGFREFFDDLAGEERAQVWGMTFDDIDADRVDACLATFPDEFDALSRQLHAHVVDRIQRHFDVEGRAAIYGFSTQFDALREPLTRLLTEACGASPYARNALMRGVYFTSAEQDGVTHARSASTLAASLRASASSGPMAAGNGRGYFITRLLREVVFRESGLARTRFRSEARRVTSHRVAVAALAGLAVALCAALAISYDRNQKLIAQTEQASEALAKLAQDGIGVDDPQSMLALLDAARDLPAGYGARDARVPWLSRVGLYQGDRLGAVAQAQYGAFLHDTVQRWLVERMEQRLRDGNLDSAERYDLLRLYLMLADKSHYDANAVLGWAQRDIGGLGLTAAQQADLMAHVRALLDASTFRADASLDPSLVQQTRAALMNDAAAKRLFESIRPQLEKAMPDPLSVSQMAGVDAPLALRRKSGQPLSGGVAGAYTLAGYRHYVELREAALAGSNDDGWVLGKPEGTQDADGLSALRAGLDDVYFDHYIAAWDAVIDDIEVLPLPRSGDGASGIVKLLAGHDSPLRLFLLAAAKQTTLEGANAESTKDVAVPAGRLDKIVSKARGMFHHPAERTRAQAPVPDAVGPTPVDRHFDALHRLISSAGDGAAAPFDQVQGGLKELAVFLDAVSAAREGGLPPPPGDALDKFKQLAQGQPAPLGGMLGSLSTNGQSVALHSERGRLTDLWRANVVPFWHAALDGRYPLDAQSKVDVTLDDFTHVFGPGGLVDTFFKTNLQQYVDTTTEPWQWRSNAKMLHMSPDTLTEFQRAAAIRDAFFADGGKAPSVRFQLVPRAMDAAITRFTLKLNDQTLQYAHDPQRAVSFQWPRTDGAQIARVEYEPGSSDGRGGFSTSGPWALFHMLDKGKLAAIQSDRFDLTFELDRKKVVLELDASSVVNPFALSALTQICCPDQL
ncbi:type VI secretion system membrane subunit TssM [Trinickia fusca]|nr:type VI secretion system membrane subunit TssM [Trinickia fusca]